MKTKFILFIPLLLAQILYGQTNWNVVSQPGTNFIIINDTDGYSFINELQGSHGSQYTLSKSTDRFQTFTKIKSETGDFGCYTLEGMFFIDTDTGFIAEVCGGWSGIYKTVDGGLNWTNTGFGGSFGLSMFFLSANFGYYSYFPGTGSNISYFRHNGTGVYTTNKYIFTTSNSLHPDYNTKIKFLNDSTGFIICKDTSNNAVILKTSNFGYNWSEKKIIPNGSFNDIIFISDSIGFVVGKSGVILKTSNSGESWSEVNSNSFEELNSIDFFNNYACIVGDSGIILKSTDFGNNWIQENFTNTNDLIYVKLFNNGITYINNSLGTLYTNQASSILEYNNSTIRIYPNPTKEILNISFDSKIKKFKINVYDLRGTVLLTTEKNVIDLSNIVPGIYFIELTADKMVLKTKFVKQ